jgi:hypothetical protein
VHALLAYDRTHDTEYFQGLRAEDVRVHEDRIDEFLAGLALPAPVRADVLAWYAEHLRSPEAILAANRPYQGVLGVIRVVPAAAGHLRGAQHRTARGDS